MRNRIGIENYDGKRRIWIEQDIYIANFSNSTYSTTSKSNSTN